MEIGKTYEMVQTTLSGLYRYRSGDIIQIVDFHEKCPVFRMLYRWAYRCCDLHLHDLGIIVCFVLIHPLLQVHYDPKIV